MPEGDTIFRAARTLHRALAGKTVVRFASVFPALTRIHDDTPITGRAIASVSSAGKHLLMRFSGPFDSRDSELAQGRLVLRTHMRMSGSWHIYRPGERWQRPRHDMRIVVATDDFEAVGFNIPEAEFIKARDVPRHGELRRLGPDLLSEDFDEGDAIRRIQTRTNMPIGDVLLNQRVIAGIGNVYKSEVLFACGVSPFAMTGTLPAEVVRRIVQTARKFLRINVSSDLAAMTTYTGFRRTTRRDDPSQRLWVYGRARLPCRRCGTAIQVRAQGSDARLTYWCPKCQG